MFSSRIRPLIVRSKRIMAYKSVFNPMLVSKNTSYALRYTSQFSLGRPDCRLFSTKNDKPNNEEDAPKEEQDHSDKEEADEAADTIDSGKGMWFNNTKQRMVSKLINQTVKEKTEGEEEQTTEETETQQEELETFEGKPVHKMYTLKFNSPILPYSKFPLIQNK